MSQAERAAYQDGAIDSDVKAAVGRRYLAIQQAYLRVAHMQGMGIEQREDYLREVAIRSGRDFETLRRETEWAESIREADLVEAFSDRPDWLERIDIEHLMLVDKARVGTHCLTSTQKCGRLVVAYDAGLKAGEFKAYLIEQGLLQAPKGMASTPAKGTTATAALRELADYLERTGQDFPMSSLYLDPMGKGRPISLFEALAAIRDRYFKLYPKLLIPREMAQRWTTKAPRT